MDEDEGGMRRETYPESDRSIERERKFKGELRAVCA